MEQTSNLLRVGNTYQPRACVGYYKLIVTGTASPVVTIGSSNIPANANYAIFTVESSMTTGYVVRCTFSTTVLTSTIGRPFADGGSFDANLILNILGFSAISLTGSDEIIHIEFYE